MSFSLLFHVLFCIGGGVFVYSSTSEECLHGLFVNCFFPDTLKRRIRCICECKVALRYACCINVNENPFEFVEKLLPFTIEVKFFCAYKMRNWLPLAAIEEFLQ